MADKRHAFVPSANNPKSCGYVVSRPGGRWGTSTCGLPVGNPAVHAPGCKPTQPERPHLTIVPDRAAKQEAS